MLLLSQITCQTAIADHSNAAFLLHILQAEQQHAVDARTRNQASASLCRGPTSPLAHHPGSSSSGSGFVALGGLQQQHSFTPTLTINCMVLQDGCVIPQQATSDHMQPGAPTTQPPGGGALPVSGVAAVPAGVCACV